MLHAWVNFRRTVRYAIIAIKYGKLKPVSGIKNQIKKAAVETGSFSKKSGWLF